MHTYLLQGTLGDWFYERCPVPAPQGLPISLYVSIAAACTAIIFLGVLISIALLRRSAEKRRNQGYVKVTQI